MSAPTDDALIVERPRPWGPPQEMAILGQVARQCSGCGRQWDRPDRCADCGSFEFTETVIQPKGMVITALGIAAVKEPPKPSALADPTDLDALRGLKAALVETEARLGVADAAARRLVNVNATNFECFSHLQEVLNLMLSPGDFEIVVGDPLKAVGLRQMVHALIGEIDRTVLRYEEAKKKA